MVAPVISITLKCPFESEGDATFMSQSVAVEFNSIQVVLQKTEVIMDDLQSTIDLSLHNYLVMDYIPKA